MSNGERPGWLTPPMSTRFAGLLIAYDGRVPHSALRALAVHHGYTGSARRADRAGSRGSVIAAVVQHAMAPLRRLNVADRHGDEWQVTNLADLAAWLADEMEERDDLGLRPGENPSGQTPQPRRAG